MEFTSKLTCVERFKIYNSVNLLPLIYITSDVIDCYAVGENKLKKTLLIFGIFICSILHAYFKGTEAVRG